jgi:hypothetical protein
MIFTAKEAQGKSHSGELTADSAFGFLEECHKSIDHGAPGNPRADLFDGVLKDKA